MMETQIKDGLLSNYLRRARLTRAARYFQGTDVLDIGCDQGYLIPYLPRDVVYHGIDANPQMLKGAKKRYPDYTFGQLLLTHETMHSLPEKQFDSIFMVAVAEHLEEPIAIFRYLHTRLKPGGCLVITSPDIRAHLLLVWLARLRLARNDKHEHRYINEAMLEPLIKENLYHLKHAGRFQFGLNHLWVLEKK